MNGLSALTLIVFLFVTSPGYAEDHAGLQITEPIPGTIVQLGQVLHVKAILNNTVGYSSVYVTADKEGVCCPLQSPTSVIECDIQIPTNSAFLGEHFITANGIGPNGVSGSHPFPILITVVPKTKPTALHADRTMVKLGSYTDLSVLATIEGSEKRLANELLKFESANPSIAEVNQGGVVLGKTTGNTFVTVTYSEGETILKTQVPLIVFEDIE